MNLLTENYLLNRLSPRMIMNTVSVGQTVTIPIPHGEERLLIWVTNEVKEINKNLILKQGFHWLAKQNSVYIDWLNSYDSFSELKIQPTSGATRIIIWDLMK